MGLMEHFRVFYIEIVVNNNKRDHDDDDNT